MSYEVEVFNPNNKKLEELPTIYGFNNTVGYFNDLDGILIAEDGNALGAHICSSEGFMVGDLGILKGSRPDRHKTFPSTLSKWVQDGVCECGCYCSTRWPE